MKKLRVITIVGTRPEIIRLSRVIARLEEHTEHTIIHTGQNYDYELNQIFFDDFNIRKPDHFLNAAAETGAATIGKIIAEVDPILKTTKPDCVLVLGDTNSCLSVIAAKRRKIPIFHMEAGNRCFDQRVPEEINRRIVDHTSDINLPYSAIAREYLLSEGFPADRIITTGSPMYEVLNFNREKIEQSTILEKLGLRKHKYFVVSAHREENVDSNINLDKFAEIMNGLARRSKLPIIVSTHPRTQKRIAERNIVFLDQIRLMKPLGFFDYNHLQINAKCVLSDSGTINEESSILNFPALNIREAHERPEAMEEGSVMMVGMNDTRVAQAIEILEQQCRGEHKTLYPAKDYQSPNVSQKVLRILHSYTDYVDRVVWRNY